eukprot:IDg5919t1
MPDSALHPFRVVEERAINIFPVMVDARYDNSLIPPRLQRSPHSSASPVSAGALHAATRIPINYNGIPFLDDI